MPPTSAGVHESQPTPDRRRRPSARRSLVVVGLVVVAGLSLWRVWPGGPAPLTRTDVDHAVQSGIAKAQQQQRNAPPDAAAAYRTISPSLVTVTARTGSGGPTTGPTGGPSSGPSGGPSSGASAGPTPPSATAGPGPSVSTGVGVGIAGASGSTSLGAGVVINAAGAVLTALHVVAGSQAIEVQFADGTTSAARITTSDPANDVAVLGVAQLPSVVVPAVMAGTPGIGDPVFPVGNPFGLRDSLTAGVVSALGRSVTVSGGRTLQGLIQFDAAVNPGNSGGPLLDWAGHVVGIVTGLANPTEQAYFVGVGFAVPIATAGGVAGGPQQ